MNNSTPTPPPSVPQGMREAVDLIIDDILKKARVTVTLEERNALVAAIAPHVAQAVPIPERESSQFRCSTCGQPFYDCKHPLATPPSLPASEGKTLGGDSHGAPTGLYEVPVIPSEPASRASSHTAVLTRAKEALACGLGFVMEMARKHKQPAYEVEYHKINDAIQEITALLSAQENAGMGGKLVRVGTFTTLEQGEPVEVTGYLIRCDEADIAKVKHLPMYRHVSIVESAPENKEKNKL